MRRLAWLFFFVVALAACDQPLTLSDSCSGGHSGNCPPYAFAEVAGASLQPAALRPGQLAATAHVHVDLRTCGAMGPVHTVRIIAHASTSSPVDDAGPGDTSYMVAEVSDDGSNGDAMANDGVIDANIGNPFTAVVPGSATLTLTFQAHAAPFCDGASLDVPYMTGPTYVVMGP